MRKRRRIIDKDLGVRLSQEMRRCKHDPPTGRYGAAHGTRGDGAAAAREAGEAEAGGVLALHQFAGPAVLAEAEQQGGIGDAAAVIGDGDGKLRLVGGVVGNGALDGDTDADSAGAAGVLEIVDDPLLDLVMVAPEAHPNAEERRLLYVALTRARRQAFLLAEGGAPSSFVTELIEDGYDITVFGRQPEGDVSCPLCREGRLERRENPHDRTVFYGCSNWPLCEHTEHSCPKCGTGLPVRSGDIFRCRDCGEAIEACPACGGWLETRMGRFGRFLGCSSYPACDYTRNLRHGPGQRRRR